ncbi:NAD(P)-binding domain-containing protein [Aquimarina agarivorans]|uniref:NAD(P)-binding domain-containing protein n=1 Tax=Aquimarina agarivorans TaxID=980584 RepID=UPI000248F62F|nr:NAD(P)-binding domain-containing protein [Aquimarina agarivorans]
MNIAVLGLGWLGKPLADSFKELGYKVKGSTTSVKKLATLKKEGYKAFQVQLNENEVAGDIEALLKDTEILVLNTPPGLRRNPESNYVAKIERLIPYIVASSIEQVLFVGSTAVFEDTVTKIEINNTTTPSSNSVSGKQLMAVEKLLMSTASFETTILRFAGLVDERRHPATMMSQRKQIPNPLAQVNLIHREDCIAIIIRIISQRKWNKIYNAAYPFHSTKQEYYTKMSKKKELTVPDFNFEGVSKGKWINGAETAKDLNYSYQYHILHNS